MLIDAHCHLWLGDVSGSKETVLALCSRYHIERAFLSTLDAGDYDPDPAGIRACNDATARFMAERPGLMEGWAYLNPANPDCLEEAARCVEGLGMKGIKLWVATRCDDPSVDPVARFAAERGIPVLIHAFYKAGEEMPGESRGFHVAALAKRHPDLKILMAHMGANVYDAIKCVKNLPNVSVDFSGSIFRRDDLDYAVRHLGAERVLFGSDMPIAFECCYGQVLGADLTDRERALIFRGNAIRLFRLEEYRAK